MRTETLTTPAHQQCARRKCAFDSEEGKSDILLCRRGHPHIQPHTSVIHQGSEKLTHLPLIDAVHWTCPDCRARSELDGNSGHASPRIETRTSLNNHDTTAANLANDLLPSPRGVRPDSHSVFDQLVHTDDPLNGSRLLRKRKPSFGTTNSEDKTKPRVLRKRRKNSSTGFSSISVGKPFS